MAAAILRRLTPTPTTAASPRVAPRPLLARGVSDSTDAITVETSVPFMSHIVDPPSRTATTSARELLSFFRDMALMRRAEISADSLYKAKLIRGFCHLYDGQEAVAVGMEAAITRADAIITAYRDHCAYLARGGDLVAAFAELMGRRDGCSRGKGGSMHFYKRDANFFSGHGIVGTQVPLGVRHRLRADVQEGGHRHLRPLRRRRRQPGPALRGAQHGRALEAACHIGLREQPL